MIKFSVSRPSIWRKCLRGLLVLIFLSLTTAMITPVGADESPAAIQREIMGAKLLNCDTGRVWNNCLQAHVAFASVVHITVNLYKEGKPCASDFDCPVVSRGHGVYIGPSAIYSAAHVVFPSLSAGSPASISGFPVSNYSGYVLTIERTNGRTAVIVERKKIDFKNLPKMLTPKDLALTDCFVGSVRNTSEAGASRYMCLAAAPAAQDDFVVFSTGEQQASRLFVDLLPHSSGPFSSFDMINMVRGDSSLKLLALARFAGAKDINNQQAFEFSEAILKSDGEGYANFTTQDDKDFVKGVSGAPIFIIKNGRVPSIAVYGLVRRCIDIEADCELKQGRRIEATVAFDNLTSLINSATESDYPWLFVDSEWDCRKDFYPVDISLQSMARSVRNEVLRARNSLSGGEKLQHGRLQTLLEDCAKVTQHVGYQHYSAASHADAAYAASGASSDPGQVAFLEPVFEEIAARGGDPIQELRASAASLPNDIITAEASLATLRVLTQIEEILEKPSRLSAASNSMKRLIEIQLRAEQQQARLAAQRAQQSLEEAKTQVKVAEDAYRKAETRGPILNALPRTLEDERNIDVSGAAEEFQRAGVAVKAVSERVDRMVTDK